jgi:hypothetical protein
VRWLLLCFAFLFLITYVSTAVFGTQAVREAIYSEALAGNRSLKAQAPRAVHTSFGGPEFATCRAIFPGLVYCKYNVYLGMKAASGYEALYLWDGSRCRKLWSKLLWVS